MTIELYPAIDVRRGEVVRLHQGDYAQETRYPLNPLAQASAYAQAGARWLHLVDLDAARAGGYTLSNLLRAIRTETGLRIQTGGGIRDRADVERLLSMGAERVVIGSLAVREPAKVAAWLSELGADHLTIALDARQDNDGIWRLPTAGWTQTGAQQLSELLQHYSQVGLRHLLCTDIDRDGTLTGPNIALYRQLRELAPGVAVQASGGVSEIADIRAARDVGCTGVVLGKALLEGRFALADALAAVEPLPC